MPEAVQALLKRRPGTSVAEFQAYYQSHHAKLVTPWCKANGVTYYAQIHGPLQWTTSTSNPTISLADWDAAAEMVFPPGFQLEQMAEREYYEEMILPDERRFLLDEARRHMVVVTAGSVEGRRVEVIKGGNVVLGEGVEWEWET
ncbi:hypothetical protein KC343_g1620 [Hortaea werneckii]|uniref:EthD domain-containing protein n=1 Tax=Hortaea werneckii TaxID=91943 RepID=A0A3M7ETA7_HORWE|nr:hypothetical protein KC352_g8132 [Hortaea werneckii]KAI7570322.1 hypothetical protein KC317_g2569 [Hortaea werneckii]KAI7626183.1 hypothetical protein KC346_g1392 [Hortaea werneckii]KAI7635791.1 hypothetical protein KC343_g1620 [Hortaea werneckii]KAI7680522.1 hypothetical protein KC319_g2119 [Hortaea werneckii]